jgi:hypothetical protein
MYNYEVRVLTAERQPSLILVGPHHSIMKAFRTARKLASDGQIVQVWRDYDCIHSEYRGAPGSSTL